jgi:hypothetical protein
VDEDDLDDDDDGTGEDDDDVVGKDDLDEDEPDLIVVEDSMVVSSAGEPEAAPIVMEPAVTDPPATDVTDIPDRAAAADATDTTLAEPAWHAGADPAAATASTAADAEPADAEPADTELADTEPADAEPADAELADAELADAEPADAEPAAAEPAADIPGAASAGDQPGPQVASMGGDTTQFQERWLAIQSDFVDDPRRSVTSASELVQEAIENLVARIRQQEASLRGTWDDPSADTEVLRKVLVDYRSFLDKIAAM